MLHVQPSTGERFRLRDDPERYTVTIQRPRGKTPGEIVGEAKQQARKAEAERDVLQAERDLTHHLFRTLTDTADVLTALRVQGAPEGNERGREESERTDRHGRSWGPHPFVQSRAVDNVRACICGKWPDHHIHGADPCGCDACRAPGDAEEATDG